MTPRWWFHRLRKMSPAEVARRAGEQVRVAATVPGSFRPTPWEDLAEGELRVGPLPAPDPPDEAPEHAWIYTKKVRLRQPIRWFEGTTEHPWPRRHHALIPHRPGGRHGDIRPVWELHRLQFLPHLALACPGRAIALLRDWLQQNPYRIGPAWMSALEVANRWIAVHRTAALLGDQLPPRMALQLDGLGRASAEYLTGHNSADSSAGNHLVKEALGMIWLAHALDPAPPALLETGRHLLAEQFLLQVHPDGSPAEASFWYLGSVIDAVQHWLLIEPEAVPVAVTERLAAALDLVHALTTPDGLYPDLGDRDDALPFRDHLGYDSPFPGLLEVGARQLGRSEWRQRHPSAARRAAWFTTGKPPKLPRKQKPSTTAKRTTFEGAGWTLLTRGEGRAVFTHGPLGMPPNFAHGHAGALGLTLSQGEVPLLVDPGTGAYNDAPMLRDHFRSTAAHNTVALGGRDQAEMLGPFLWRRGWTCTVEERLDDGLTASCDAYVAALGVSHRRTVRWIEPGTLEVVDRFPGAANHTAAAHWQLHPACERVELTATGVRCHFDGLALEAELPMATWTVHRGELEPMRGWVAPRYGEVLPAPLIRVSGRVSTATTWRTVWRIA